MVLDTHLRVIHVYMVYHLSCGPSYHLRTSIWRGSKMGCFQPDETTTLRLSAQLTCSKGPLWVQRGLPAYEVSHLLKGVYLGIVSHTTSHLSPSWSKPSKRVQKWVQCYGLGLDVYSSLELRGTLTSAPPWKTSNLTLTHMTTILRGV